MSEQPAVALRLENGRYLVTAELTSWPDALALFRQIGDIGEQEPRPFTGEELLPDDEPAELPPGYVAAPDPCPPDCARHPVHVAGTDGAPATQ